MTPIINSIWHSLQDEEKYYQGKKIIFNLDKNKFEEFKKSFTDLNNSIKDIYMKPNVNYLDRHKVASIIIVSILKTNLISYDGQISENKVFLGAELIATEIALSWMLKELKKELTIIVENNVEHYFMPQAWTCDTPYFEVFCRNLYYAQKDYVLNPLDISEKLFLLEYITLLRNNINPDLLKK